MYAQFTVFESIWHVFIAVNCIKKCEKKFVFLTHEGYMIF